jgi:hypothetical protein
VSASNACGLSGTRGKVVGLTGNSPITSLPGTVNSDFNIYPNPAKNTCLVVFTEKKQVHYTFSVTNTNGKTLYIKQGKSFIGVNMITVDLSGFPVGSYFVNLIDIENGNQVEKLNKE